MSLTRATTTRASQIALPGHALLAISLSIAWLWQAPPESSPGLAALNSAWPLHNTAVVLLSFGVVEFAMLLLVHSRTAEAITLGAAVLLFVVLAAMSARGHVSGTSWGGVILWIYVATMHLASLVSLAFYEGTSE